MVNSSITPCEESKEVVDPVSKRAESILSDDWIKSRLRHPGLLPLIKLNSERLSQRKVAKSQQAAPLKQTCPLCKDDFICENGSVSPLPFRLCSCHKEVVDNQFRGIRCIKDISKGRALVKDMSGQSLSKTGDDQIVCVLCREVQKTYEDLIKDVSEHRNMLANYNDLLSKIEQKIITEIHHVNTQDNVKQEMSTDFEIMMSSTADNAVVSHVRDNCLDDNIGIREPETVSADTDDKDGCCTEKEESKDPAISEKQQRNILGKKSSKIEAAQAKVEYRIEDSVLAGLRENYTGCLLCGHIFDSCSKLSTHLYFCHKVTATAHHKVLLLTDLAERRAMLGRLKKSSTKQMVLSGKHCPICFVGMLNSKNLICHMAVHVGHPQYEEHLGQLMQNMKLSEQYRTASKMHKKPSKGKEVPSGKKDQKVKCGQVESGFSKTVVCSVCDREFVSGAQLRKHLNNLHLLSWVDYIALDALSEEDRKDHIHIIKRARKTRYNSTEQDSVDYAHQIIDCAKCSESIPCQKYGAHLELEHPEMDNINEIISSMNCVLHHAKIPPLSNATVQCPFCKLDLKHTQALRHLKLLHRGEDDFLDTLCQMKLELKSLVSKMRNTKRKERVALKIRLLCRFCGTPFADQSTQSFHENYSCEKNERRQQKYTCKFCGHRGTTEIWYKEHIRQHNPAGPNYICSLCGNGYMNKSGLDTHKAKDHRNVKRYSCAQCGKEFYVHSHYESHLLKHSDERAFMCQLCNKKFKSAGSKRRHIKTIHSEHIKDKETLDKRKRNHMLNERGHEGMEHNSWQIKEELDNHQTMQGIACTIEETETLETEQQGAGNISVDSHLLPADVAKIQIPSTEPLDMVDLESSMQQVEGPSPLTTLDTVMNSMTFQNPAGTEIHCMPVIDAHGMHNNVPMQYTLDSYSLLASHINSGDDVQIILEIYFDERGNVINNMSDVLQVEQPAIYNPSDVQQ